MPGMDAADASGMQMMQQPYGDEQQQLMQEQQQIDEAPDKEVPDQMPG